MDVKALTKMKRSPTHPGEILLKEFMEPMSLSVTRTAKALLVSRKTVSKIVNERGSITADMAIRLSRAFRTTLYFWLNLQWDYGLWHAIHDSQVWKSIKPIPRNPRRASRKRKFRKALKHVNTVHGKT